MVGEFFGSKKKLKLLVKGKEIDVILPADEFKNVKNDNIDKFAVFVPSTQQQWTLHFNKTNKEINLPFTCSYEEFKATFPKQLCVAVAKEVLGPQYIKNIHIEAIGFYEEKFQIKITINAVYATSILNGRPCDVVSRKVLVATMNFS